MKMRSSGRRNQTIPDAEEMRHPCGGVLVATIVALLLGPAAWAAGDDPETAVEGKKEVPISPTSLFGLGRQEIGLTVGYGFGVPLGGSKDTVSEDVQYAYVAPRWGIGISNPIGGDAWYRGNIELLIEGAFIFNHEPTSGSAAGGTAMFRYNFLSGDKFIPFLEVGAGIISLDFDLSTQADGLNFTTQGGAGFHYFVTERTALTAEWRLHHISNAGINSPNIGINSSLFLLGVSVFLN
ncbi:MAG: acyloxyacyl hydrolase [Gammaproteobacteria bacterium]|nr:acyloxyacyl hydrolase [Gammaproteobacteria bacterium]